MKANGSVMKALKQSPTIAIGFVALVIACLFPWLQLEAEPVTPSVSSPQATGPMQATGPLEATPTTGPSAVAILSRPQFPHKTKFKPAFRVGDTDVDEFVSQLMAEMTLNEKLGQLSQAPPSGDVLSQSYVDAIVEGKVGSIFFAGNEEQIRIAQKAAVERSRLGIPLIIARDVIHGFRTIFPIPIGQASSWNPELIQRAAEVAASESKKVGIHWTFAPMVDISRDPRWGRIAESCGEDPVLASALGAAMVRGFQSVDAQGKLHGIGACAKHFVAYGLSEGGRDYNRAMVSRSELHNVFFPPFKGCVDAGAVSLMTAFNTINGVPASGHSRLLRDVLKRRWAFPGFVVSDWQSVTEMIAHGYAADEKQAAQLAMTAGVDMEMVSTSYRDNLPELLTNNAVQMEMIDDAVRRILHTKLRLNLFADPYADDRQPELLAANHLATAKELAQQSVVLLKNDEVLPLDHNSLRNVAVIGPLAHAPKDQLGCWVQDASPEDSITPLTALREALGEGVTVTHVPCMQTKYDVNFKDFEEAVAAAKNADVVLLFVGEEEALSGEAHSRTNLCLPGSQSKLVEALRELDVPTVMVVIAGRPLTITQETTAVDALLYAWHPGTMGGPAIADILLGAVSPSGKLPVTFPKVTGQVPLYYNHMSTGRPSHRDYRAPDLEKVSELDPGVRYQSHYVDSDPFPLFHFGFGLSYTKFEYGKLELSTETVEQGQTLTAKTTITNVGSRKATEVVQLYIRDLVASQVRPVKELKRFKRVTVPPGETVEVEFSLPYEQLGFFNEQEQYLVEPGDFQIAIGGSSDIEFQEKFQVK